jgi:regulator of RNase E activity RraA
MVDYGDFARLSTTTLADVVGGGQVMDIGIRPLWSEMPRLAGPALPVRCPAGDNLMLHAAIYRADPGSVIVVEAGDLDYAVAGGNVCAAAQRLGVSGFVIDGVIRDLAETRSRRFPVFARGVVPIPGAKDLIGTINATVTCGGVRVALGDIVVADEEGVVVVPAANAALVLAEANALAHKEETTTLEEWMVTHRARIEDILRAKGFHS